MKNIPFFKPYFDEQELTEIKRAFANNKFARGKISEEFESKISQLTDKKYGIAVSNATAALHLLVRYCTDKGSVMITTPFSFVASANAGLYENKEIVFTKVNEKTLLMDEDSLEEKLKQFEGKVCCVIYVSIFGLLPYSHRVKELCKKYDVFLIEDSSQSICSSNNLVKTASLGDATVISFHENKQITTGGEGGIILTDDKNIYEYSKSMRDQGRVLSQNWMDDMLLGFNYRMTEIQAAFGIAQVNKITEILKERREIVSIYERLLKDLPIQLPYNPDPKNRSWFVYNIKFNKREDLLNARNYLDINNIDYNPNYFPRINKLSPHKASEFQSDFLDEYFDQSIALPFYNGLTSSDVEFICSVIKKSIDTNSDSIGMYDNMATVYKDYVKKVSNYFFAIDSVIDKLYNKGNWLDIGSADGERIINLTRDKEVHLLAMDSSNEMISFLKSKNINCLKADISNSYTFKDKIKNRFNTVTCLYNVLGHIDNPELRNNSFKNVYNLLDDDGVFIFDVNNRWNIKQYGFLSVLRNIMKDLFTSSKSGDFKVNITLNGKKIVSSVHLFNILEVKKLLIANKFTIQDVLFVNYKTGSIKENVFGGQILIIAKKHG